jgi:hypothetical protein
VLYTGCLEGWEVIDDFFSFRLMKSIIVIYYGRVMAGGVDNKFIIYAPAVREK